MGNSGKLAVIAAFVSLGLLVLAAVVLEELVLYLFLGAVLLCYLSCIVQLFNRRRYLVVLLGAAGTSLFIGFSIAFLRMWGLAFNQDTNAMGSAVSTEDSDIYFYLAAVAGVGTLAVMFLGAVMPSFGSRAPAPAKRPASGAKRIPAARKPTPRPASPRPTTPAKRPTAPRPSSGASKTTAVKRPAPRTPAVPAKRPPSSSSSQRKPAPKR
ncbi:hypothetical protein LRQ04_10200 [Paenarthrobacter sp. AR 02]|uniref:hypothetical protein n=1 Tax=Paenarthrobacter sp. AR 02 TaxID=2899821 RepID=UPI001F1D115A|nr:hypothetical protein [Paenarthrobacter sp. AR 02]MCF3139628.1 hypothetical protein [Paenarthrobacter sp. AR 02]